MAEKDTGYALSRSWWDFAFENPELVKPIHSAIFFFAIEHRNRLGWKEKFGFPSQMAMDAIGVKKYDTYTKGLFDLVEWGFVLIIERSKNQYSSNIISIKCATPKNGKALDKANIRHGVKHRGKQSESMGESTGESTGESMGESTGESMGSIDKQRTKNKELNNQEQIKHSQFQILEPEEILNRLKHSEYQVQEFICRTYQLSPENYGAAVEMFVGEKTAGANELQKDYAEVVGQFKSWVKFHSQKLKKHFENGETGTGKQRTTGHNITGVVDAADSILAAAAGKLGT